MVTHRVAERRLSRVGRTVRRARARRSERPGDGSAVRRSSVAVRWPSTERRRNPRATGRPSALSTSGLGLASRDARLWPDRRPTDSAARPPSASWSRRLHLVGQLVLRPIAVLVDGSRTRDTQGNNLMLYQSELPRSGLALVFEPRCGTRTADRKNTRKARRRADETGRLLEKLVAKRRRWESNPLEPGCSRSPCRLAPASLCRCCERRIVKDERGSTKKPDVA